MATRKLTSQRRKPQTPGQILAPATDAAWVIYQRDPARGRAILQALLRALYKLGGYTI